MLLARRGIGKRYGAVEALNGADLDVAAGDVLGICGDNGAGKSTLIRIISGAQEPSAGSMVLRGVEVRFASPHDALVAAGGITVSAASATLIQLWFRTQARRKHFRRRQTSSRVATFAEAFSSISWAGTFGLAAAGRWQAATITALIAIGILAGARALAPKKT